jgi:hypothetical protein
MLFYLKFKEIYDEYSWRGEHSFGKRECNVSLLNLLDDLSPALFLYPGFFELRFSNNMLEIVR